MAQEGDSWTYRREQRWLCYRYHVYHTFGTHLEERDRNLDQFRRFCVPRPGQYPGVEKSFRVAPTPAFTYGPHRSQRRKTARVSTALRKLKQDLKPLTGVRFAKVLGWGGNGLAALFFSEDRRTSYRRQYFVVKVDIAGGGGDSSGSSGSSSSEWIQRELRIQSASLCPSIVFNNGVLTTNKTNRFQDAMHIVQLAGLPRPMPPLRSRRIRAQQGGQGSQAPAQPPVHVDTEGLIILEYLMCGSLHKALSKATEAKQHFPNRVLWHMFHCLVQSCVAMAYAPTENGHLYNGMQPPFMERINPQERKRDFVHFDIVPNNILVGDPGRDPDHPLLPVLKMGDFGLGRTVTRRHYVQDDLPWYYRTLGKFGYFTPEQFSAEWDYIPLGRGPLSLAEPWSVAGKYFWTHNLFQIGLVMTRTYPLVPPHPQRMWVMPEDDDRDGGDEDRQRRVKRMQTKEPFHHQRRADSAEETYAARAQDDAEPQRREDNAPIVNDSEYDSHDDRKCVWSYGAYLLKDQKLRERGVDPYMRTLVARCLCDQPQDRPRLAWLKMVIGNRIRDGRWPAAEDDHRIREWMEKIKW
ncbi:uncharacterized protein B0T15DRAFT_555276 [Chaetomium strumarium]|uniref:Protein kinase domain-containing protein n=1 Tax=Chaetomium strumarium TaxID=1170767 RepID=A0AAJ0GSF8_9PEZI|nr:hypothetical protein B0T15DRAFT_555276 [Chaetomium strumarium]